MFRKLIYTVTLLTLIAFGSAATAAQPITEAEVLAAQKAWGEGIVAIGKAFTDHGDYAAAAQKHLDTLYGYDAGPVLFKPTKAAEDQFRETEEQALSYFVKGIVPEDKGFAINPWTNVRFDNHQIVLDGPMAIAMGNYYFTDPKGTETKVEYVFGYKKADDGRVLITLHHSSLPYAPH